MITESRVGKLAGVGVTNTRYFPNCVSTKAKPFEQQETVEKILAAQPIRRCR